MRTSYRRFSLSGTALVLLVEKKQGYSEKKFIALQRVLLSPRQILRFKMILAQLFVVTPD
jgi:hypothetical protein